MPMEDLFDKSDEDEDTVTFEDVRCTKATAKALLVSIDGDPPIWIPLSQVNEDSEVFSEGDEGKLVVTRWIAEQKGLV